MARDSQKSKVYLWEDHLRWYTLLDRFAEHHELCFDVRVEGANDVRILHPTARSEVIRTKSTAAVRAAFGEAAKEKVIEYTHWLHVDQWMLEERIWPKWHQWQRHSNWQLEFETQQECQRYVLELWHKYSPTNRPPPSVMFSGRGSTSWYEKVGNRMGLAEFGRTPRIIIHEFAHYLMDHKHYDHPAHGPAFAAVLLKMLVGELEVNETYARYLAKQGRVRIGEIPWEQD